MARLSTKDKEKPFIYITMAFTTTARNSEAVIGVAVAAFPGHPLVYLAIILGPVVELPMLLLLARILLGLRERLSIIKI